MLSLMLLTLVMFSTLSLATILVTELRSARFSDSSVVAHYAAESGSEQALFLLKEARSADELGAANPYSQLFGVAGSGRRVDGFAASSDLERRYSFTKISTTSDTFIAYNIPLNTSVQLDVFDPLQEYSISPSTKVQDIHIDWEVNQASQTSQKLEVTKLSYAFNGSSIEIEEVPGKPNPEKQYFTCQIVSGTTCTSASVNLSPNRFYHLTVRPIDGDIKKVAISATDNTGALAGIPSQIFIKTTGRYREASQEVTVQTPWDNGTSDIFNYVIFSDSSLIKNILNTSVEAFPSMCGNCINNQLLACSSANDCLSVGGRCQVNNPSKIACNHLDDGSSPGEGDNPVDISQNNNGLCNARCSGYTYCGDGTLQTPNGVGIGGSGNGNEQCDDGNISNTDLCTTACLNTVCGDGYINQPNAAGFTEICDETVPCDASHPAPNCKSNTVVNACKTDCSGRVTSGPPPPPPRCPPDCRVLD